MEYELGDIEDNEALRKAKGQRDAAKKSEDEDLKWLMANKRGRRIVWRLLEQAAVFRPSFSSDALVMAFNEGTKDQGRRLLNQVQIVCSDLYFEMTKENVK
jgi:hypothetical protein